MYYIQTKNEKIPTFQHVFITVRDGQYIEVPQEQADGVNAYLGSDSDNCIMVVAFAFEGHTLLGDEEVAALIWEDDPEPEPVDPDEEIDSDTFKSMIEEIL
jgi:hypothetical protein